MSIDGVGRSGALPTTTLDGAAAPATAAPLSPQELQAKLMQQLLADLGGIAQGKADGVEGKAPKGAPQLAAPTMTFSAEDSALILGALQNKLTDSQIKTSKEGIQLDREKKDALHKEAMKKLEDAAKKLAEASGLKKLGFIFNIIAKIAAVVAAAIAVAAAAALSAATAGAATPLLVVACIGLALVTVDATCTVADAISKQFGGPDLTLNGIMTTCIGKMLEGFGVDEEKAKEIAGWTAMAIQVAVAVAMIAASIAATIMTGGAAAGSLMASIATITSSFVQAGISIGQGSITIATSVVEKQAADAQADKLDFDKLIQKLQKQMEEESERVSDLVQQLDEGMQRISSIIAAGGETRMQISRNMV